MCDQKKQEDQGKVPEARTGRVDRTGRVKGSTLAIISLTDVVANLMATSYNPDVQGFVISPLDLWTIIGATKYLGAMKT